MILKKFTTVFFYALSWIKETVNKLNKAILIFKSWFTERPYLAPSNPNHAEKLIHFNIDMGHFYERAQNMGNESLKMAYSFIKVIALTTATIIIFRLIFSTSLNFHDAPDWDLMLRFLLWTISFIILLITYDASMFGSIFVITILPRWVTVLPIIFSVFEFLVFAILSPKFFMAETPMTLSEMQVTTAWFIINGVYHIFTSIFCAKGVALHEENYRILDDKDLKQIYRCYRDWIERERFESLLVGIVCLAVAFLSTFIPDSYLAPFQLAIAVPLLAGVYNAYGKQHKKRHAVNVLISKKNKISGRIKQARRDARKSL